MRVVAAVAVLAALVALAAGQSMSISLSCASQCVPQISACTGSCETAYKCAQDDNTAGNCADGMCLMTCAQTNIPETDNDGQQQFAALFGCIVTCGNSSALSTPPAGGMPTMPGGGMPTMPGGGGMPTMPGGGGMPTMPGGGGMPTMPGGGGMPTMPGGGGMPTMPAGSTNTAPVASSSSITTPATTAGPTPPPMDSCHSKCMNLINNDCDSNCMQLFPCISQQFTQIECDEETCLNNCAKSLNTPSSSVAQYNAINSCFESCAPPVVDQPSASVVTA